MSAYALVTGASSGIGRALAIQLADRGYSLILVARRLERLNELKAEILKTNTIPIEVICADLGVPGAAQTLFDEVERRKLDVEVLVNNAGFGSRRQFLDDKSERLENMVLLNVQTLTQLTLLFGNQFRQKKRGFVLLVSSIGGFMPCPGMSAYAATKAYVQSLGEALALEWRGSGVSLTTLSPGMTITEFFEVAGQNVHKSLHVLGMSPERVARIGLRALFRRRAAVTPGFSNKINVFFMRILPRWLVVRIVARVVKMTM